MLIDAFVTHYPIYIPQTFPQVFPQVIPGDPYLPYRCATELIGASDCLLYTTGSTTELEAKNDTTKPDYL